MRYYPIFLLALVALSLAACKKDMALTEEKAPFQSYLEEADLKVSEADALTEQNSFVGNRAYLLLEAYSIDGLQKAIDSVGPFGTVLVESGMHYESGTVTATHPVRIIGEPGAVIQSTTAPDAEFPYVGAPALYLNGAERSFIQGLRFVPDPATGMGGTAILVANSDRVNIRDNDFEAYFQAVLVHKSDYVRIFYNRAEGLYSEGFANFNSQGYSIVSGNNAYLRGNTAEDFWINYFVSDKDGILYKNTATGGVYGFFLCAYGEGAMELPDGTSVGAEFPATNWLAYRNTAQGMSTAYLVIDGANNSRLINNMAREYTDYGVEFAGITERFGGVLPASFDNKFAIGGRDFWEFDPDTNTWVERVVVWVKDCGAGNDINGGRLVDTSVDMCE
ncbi:MAG: hypothetical protein H6559_24850 [Lewinellaceae bacterium]|nr:hypothetical protein [Lewinellaceae bacterium]